MHTEDIRSLEQLGFDQLYGAWEDAFRDYDRTWSYEELRQLLERRGYDPGLSFGAFDEDKLVSFILNCPGSYHGKLTAYDTGTGTIKSHRGRGLVGKIFAASLPILRKAGIEQYLLEVLQHNTTAVDIYKKTGFGVIRSFNYYVQSMRELSLSGRRLSSQYQLYDAGLDQIEEMMRMWDFEPSWQNSFDSVRRSLGDFVIKGVSGEGILVAYGITEPRSGDITQLAVAREHRRKGIGSALLKELAQYNQHPAIKLINIDATDISFDTFLKHNGITVSGQQYEMLKHL
ncbi:MAG: GNAT family N-acetyltransferase [Bacteroidetes bacterium]|nr:GNAT family N-acetyltransferase [Bacteroidota bacterium]